MQLIIDIKNENLADKIIKILEVFKNDGLKIKKKIGTLPQEETDEILEYDTDYENSIQYKLDRAEFEEMKKGL